jgi:DNA-binding response OmpR family regulator
MARILIVDDDHDMVDTSRIVLEREGYEVSCAHNSTEGMQAVENLKPDLLILDVMMDQPDDGIAMAQDLRRNGFTGPILMLTSLNKVAGFKYEKDGNLIPVDDFQEKPMDPAALVAKVADLLNRKGN